MKLSHSSFVISVCALLLLSGCTVKLRSNPASFPITEQVVPEYSAGQTVNISNYYSEPEVVSMADSAEGDLEQFTETAIALLEQGLKHRDITVISTGTKSVKLRVHNARYKQAFWTLQADVDITAELGNGKTITVHHHNASPASGHRAVSGAITRATEKILKHTDFIQYLEN